jgi:hypothetical protein
MRRFLPLVAIAVAAVAGAGSSRSEKSRLLTSLCFDTSASDGDMIRQLQTYASTADTILLRRRGNMGLSATSPDSVQLVRDSAACDRTSRTFRRIRFGVDTGPLDTVLLIRYGQKYVGTDFAPVGEWMLWSVLDTSFTVLNSFAR